MTKSPNIPSRSEVRIKARAVSRGTAVGNVVCLFGRKRQFYRVSIEVSAVAKEIRRFRAALRLAKRQLRKMSSGGDSRSSVFETHMMILDDASFIEKVEDVISRETVNAEWAVKNVTDGYIAAQKAISDDHLREKYIDLEDIADRILTALGGGKEAVLSLAKDSIVVARELRPSTLIELVASEPQAIITEHGGWTSHTFILAREMGLPAITGIRRVLRRLKTGDRVVVDGFQGSLIVNPSVSTVARYESATVGPTFRGDAFDAEFPRELKTLDGREIIIRANVDIPDVYARAKRYGARGIGLYRSEFLFNQYKGFPSEAEQMRAYRKIASQGDGDPVRIRTFDLAVDQLAAESAEKEKNPALGLRAIRLMLTHRTEFRTQMRALLQVSAEFPLDIVLPMISDISEVRETRRLLERERSALERRGIACGNPRVGAMIEVPASVLVAEDLGREVEFFCLGTNDLVQYLLAVDRDNAAAADWFRTLHPAVLRSVRTVLAAAAKCGIPIVVCGEMAGSPAYVALLVGLGATELSMNVNSMPRVRRTIEGIAYEEAKLIVGELADYRTTEEIEEHVRKRFSEKWSHIFTSDLLPARV